MNRVFFAIGSLSGLIAVAAGAFGAHALRAHLEPTALETWRTGAQYQMVHALALLATALGWSRLPTGSLQAAGWCFAVGTVLFSGSLYGLSALNLRFLGPVTPAGGLLFMLGWGLLARAALRNPGSGPGEIPGSRG